MIFVAKCLLSWLASNWMQVLGAILVGVVLWSAYGWAYYRGAAPERAKREKVEVELTATKAALESAKRNAKTNQEASDGYQKELAHLRDSSAAIPYRPVRLCKPAPAASVSVPGAAAGLEPGTAAAGVVPPTVGTVEGPDIGHDADALIDRCDLVSAQLRSVLHRDRALANQ